MPAKKTSKWITHVKAYAKANKCSYGDAMSRAKSSYQTGGGFLRNAHDYVRKHRVISRGANFLLENNLVGNHGRRIGQVRDLANKHGYGK